MDCSIVPLKNHKDLFQISTTDFFYPLVDDPFVQGQIAFCNVVSDIYAFGITQIDNVLMLLSSSRGMTPTESNIVLRRMIEGFNFSAKQAETEVTGGQTVVNEWIIIGGVAMSVCTESEFIRPVNAQPGDVIVLTKPIGTQVAVNAHEWLYIEEKFSTIKDCISIEDIETAFEKASEQMSLLNRNAASLMKKYGAHCATDVTGFGILGHASNLAKYQLSDVDFEIHTLPILKDMMKVDQHLKVNMKNEK